MNPARLIAFGLLSLVFSLFFFVSPASAQQVQEPKPDLHNYTQRVMIEVASSMTCMLSGVNAIDPNQKCLGIANGKIGPVDTSGGAIGAMGNLIAMTFTPPAHTGDFVKYLAGNFGLTKPAYAQQGGIGFSGLSPLTNVWVAFRNIVYLLFVLVFIAIGFAIMLRVKIDPRTVMTIENQIPKIIIALILVTFSFAIAGFLIDLMYVFIYLSINVFNSIDIPGIKDSIAPAFSDIQGRTPFEVVNNIAFVNAQLGGILGIVTSATAGVTKIVTDLFAGTGTPLGGLGNLPLIGGALGGIGNGIISILAFLIIAIAVLWALFRLWFTLIMAYIFILIDVVFAPFWIIAGLVPGSGLTIGNWLRHIVAYLAAFPATVIMFMLGKVFIDGFAAAQGFFPPLIGNPGAQNIVGAMVALGIILTTPNVVNMMVNAIKAPKFDLAPIAQAIGVGAGYPIGVGREIAGTIAAQREYNITNVQTGPGGVSQLTYGRRDLGPTFFRRFFR